MPWFLAVWSLAVVAITASMRPAPDVVTVEGGRIAGTSDGGVRVYKGIP
jgi:hypothetical protein